jgi:CRP/FNR family cyclic AMP-dependent transcriptional regulator
MSLPLEKLTLFEEVGEEDRVLLEDFLSARTIPPGFQIFGSGDEASELLVVSAGEVALRLQSQEIGRLGPGDMLGGISLVAIGKRECEAIAEGEAEILFLTRENYLRLRSDYPHIALLLQEGVLRNVAETLRSLLRDHTELDRGA